MFNFHNRHYIFRKSNGEIMDFYCDIRQNLCCSTLTWKGSWNEASILAKNIHQYFYAEMDSDNICHILFQDNSGNINYITFDGQSVKTVPVLNSRTPSVYNKQLYIAPLGKDVYLFYVLQHDNSFMLAYQLVRGGRPGTPKIVDYVSASNIPCSLLYDSSMNIYAFYQSYDGKYLQLGYKKFNTGQRHWSDFTPVTKYPGNCELPHAIIDSQGTLHLCYQRRAPKLFEMVYQQKQPDRNFWSAETVLHSSVHPFENASILQVEDRIIVYWIRDDVIYFNAAPLSGDNWSKPARYGTDFGRRLQCICYKDMRRRNYYGPDPFGDSSSVQGAEALLAKTQPSPAAGSVSSPAPGIYPGIVSNGCRLAFADDLSIAATSLQARFPLSASGKGSSSGDDIRQLILNVFKQMQDNISEIRAGWNETKNEMARLINAYSSMSKELSKYTIRMNMLENKLNQLSVKYAVSGRTTDKSDDVVHDPETALQSQKGISVAGNAAAESWPGRVTDQKARKTEAAKQDAGQPSDAATASKQPAEAAAADNTGGQQAKKAAPQLDPEAMKIWEEWKEPREWIEGG